MRLQELGQKVRRARLERGLTQEQLGRSVGLSRTTVSQLEAGLIRDLGFRKVSSLLEFLGSDLNILLRAGTPRPDFVKMAAANASVSFRSQLTEDELIRILLTGRVPAGRRPHIRALLDEGPSELLSGLVNETRAWSNHARIPRNLEKIEKELKLTRRVREWMNDA